MSLLDPSEVDRLILDSAQQGNVLPLTSVCESHCVFCSHKNNPPGIAVASIGRRSLAEVARSIAFLKPGHVVTIGESATPVVEGEPMSHPDFAETIRLLRRALPDTPVEITTNGRHLTAEVVALLEEAGGISLNVSLNSASVEGRRRLMGDTKEESHRAVAGVEALGRSALRFSGSLVAMPNLVGWDDLRDTVGFLASNGATAVRVVVPAYSRRADRALFPDATTIFGDVRGFVAELAAESPCPVLMEPSCPSDLRPVVSGVLEGSPAWNAGVRAGDLLEEIHGRQPRSRVDAWQMLLPAGRVRARVARGGLGADTEWVADFEGGAGITMEYDFDPDRAEKVRAALTGCGGRSLLLTSKLGYGVVSAVLRVLGGDAHAAEAVAVESLTFGGTIGASGLLTVGDYLSAYSAWRRTQNDPVAQVLVPLESFNSLGFDLAHRHVSELASGIGSPVVLV